MWIKEGVGERHSIHTYITPKRKILCRHMILNLVLLIDVGRMQVTHSGSEATKPV